MRISRTIILAGAGILAAGAAFALTPQEEAELKKNCSADYARLCSQFKPDSPEVRQCFAQKRAQVSARCQAAMAKFKG